MSPPNQQQYCTFYVADHLFGIGVSEVQEVIRYQEMTRVPIAPKAVQGLINLRGQIVTAIDLRQQLDFPPRPDDAFPLNVVVQTDDGPVSLLVDEIGDVVDVDETTWEPTPPTVKGKTRELVEGVYKLPGQFLLILATHRAVNVDDSEAA
jgi:purine-binding chemotaxis protein CheW